MRSHSVRMHALLQYGESSHPRLLRRWQCTLCNLTFDHLFHPGLLLRRWQCTLCNLTFDHFFHPGLLLRRCDFCSWTSAAGFGIPFCSAFSPSRCFFFSLQAAQLLFPVFLFGGVLSCSFRISFHSLVLIMRTSLASLRCSPNTATTSFVNFALSRPLSIFSMAESNQQE